jgi:hypothetical protein
MKKEVKQTDTILEPEFYFEDEADKEMGIQTRDYPNGSKIKQVKLKDGRIAVCRMLRGKDFKNIQRLTNGNKDEFQNAIIATSVMIDDKPIVKEDLAEMLFPDYTTLLAISSINF